MTWLDLQCGPQEWIKSTSLKLSSILRPDFQCKVIIYEKKFYSPIQNAFLYFWCQNQSLKLRMNRIAILNNFSSK